MATEQVGDYEIEYTGTRLVETEGWAAWVEVFGPSHNPMHRQPVFPSQRVAVEARFGSEQEAEQEARRIGLEMVEQSRGVQPAS